MVNNQPLYAKIDHLSQKNDYFATMFRESIDRVANISNSSKITFLHVLEYLHLDGFTVSKDDVVELWGLTDMYSPAWVHWRGACVKIMHCRF